MRCPPKPTNETSNASMVSRPGATLVKLTSWACSSASRSVSIQKRSKSSLRQDRVLFTVFAAQVQDHILLLVWKTYHTSTRHCGIGTSSFHFQSPGWWCRYTRSSSCENWKLEQRSIKRHGNLSTQAVLPSRDEHDRVRCDGAGSQDRTGEFVLRFVSS